MTGGPWEGTTRVLSSDVADRIRRTLTVGDGELQVHGSWRLLQSLLAERLVDERAQPAGGEPRQSAAEPGQHGGALP